MPVLLCCLFLFVPWQTPKEEDATPESEAIHQLAKVRRIYISILTGGDAALQIRDLLMTSLQNSKQFIITEDEDKADAVLRGSGDDHVFNEVHQSSEGIDAHSQFGFGESSGTRYTSSSSSNHSGGITIGENESRKSEERKHEAIVTVRLVSKDDDVIWSATAESLGGKFLGASADVADKIAKRLVTDFKAAKRATSQPPAPARKDAPLKAVPTGSE
ncbi:MAG TPA: hypothetical protein VF146_09870 [Bryobacteraceae bacterium]